MIVGIGTDIVEISRMTDLIQRFGDKLAQRILASSEWGDYQQSALKARFLAKRFSIKEAFSKAWGTGLRYPIIPAHIIITHDIQGKPLLNFAPPVQALLTARGVIKAHVSVSDEKNLALAMVVLEA